MKSRAGRALLASGALLACADRVRARHAGARARTIEAYVVGCRGGGMAASRPQAPTWHAQPAGGLIDRLAAVTGM